MVGYDYGNQITRILLFAEELMIDPQVCVQKLKLFILTGIVFCGMCFVLLYTTHTNVGTFNATEEHFRNDINTYLPKQIAINYTIHTNGCSIDDIQAFSQTARKYFMRPKPVNCTDDIQESLTGSNRTSFWIIEDRLSQYNVSDMQNFTCCYKYFERPNFIENIDKRNLDDRVQYYNCTPFDSCVHVKREMVRIHCTYYGKDIYDDFYIFPILKKSLRFNQTNRNEFNVLVLGIDSVSRLNFHRTMPKTLRYLKSLGVNEMLGYNKVADNTFPNLIPVLTGFRTEELSSTCLPRPYSVYDNCPFVWHWFKNAGFATAFGEDSAPLALFNYLKPGFMRAPTDYYLRTFVRESEFKAGHKKRCYTHLCLKTRFFFNVMLDYTHDLAQVLIDSRYFAFFWEVSVTHNDINLPMLMDDKYEAFFKKMAEHGLLDDTIVVIMSDHGMRYGGILDTKQGRLEARLPLLMFVFPERFKRNYNGAFENFMENSNRLTTPFDLHKTLVDLVNVSRIEDLALEKRKDDSYSTGRGISLFLPVPENRTCASADISDHWCACRQLEQLSMSSSLAFHAARFTINFLNDLLSRFLQCAKLELSEIMFIFQFDLHSSVFNGPSSDHWLDYNVVLKAKPGDGIFEATLRRDTNEDWFMAGTVSRLNLYGNQSNCIDEDILKLYCFCKD